MRASEAAIREIERARHGSADFHAAAGSRVMDLYRDRIESRSLGVKARSRAVIFLEAASSRASP